LTRPLIITAAITGSVTSSDRTPYLPTTWDQIVESAVTSWQAGGAIVHLHARKLDGEPTQNPEIFRELVDRIQATGCDAILNLSTGSAGGRANLAERLQCLELRPEMATLDCGSLNFGDERVFHNPYLWLRDGANRMRELGIRPEIEVFDTGMIANGLRLIDEGAIVGPGVWQLCLGVRGGATADLQTVAHMLSRLPDGAQWSLLGVGRHQLPLNLLSIGFGGHARTGLEDNIYYRSHELAESNAQLVERVARIAREFDRPIATPAEARQLLGIERVKAPGLTS
jgi:3-keto-5-aminohexanoate cleavage enzyme